MSKVFQLKSKSIIYEPGVKTTMFYGVDVEPEFLHEVLKN